LTALLSFSRLAAKPVNQARVCCLGDAALHPLLWLDGPALSLDRTQSDFD